MPASDPLAPAAVPEQPSGAALIPAAPGSGAKESSVKPLPLPREAMPAPAHPSRAFAVVLGGVVLLFAFLVSSSAVRNSDFWMHLAAGRLLANGEYRFGVDPFSYTSTGAYWVNHAWLFDLGLYTAYQAFGGVGLVVLKALAIAGLAWLM